MMEIDPEDHGKKRQRDVPTSQPETVPKRGRSSTEGVDQPGSSAPAGSDNDGMPGLPRQPLASSLGGGQGGAFSHVAMPRPPASSAIHVGSASSSTVQAPPATSGASIQEPRPYERPPAPSSIGGVPSIMQVPSRAPPQTSAYGLVPPAPLPPASAPSQAANQPPHSTPQPPPPLLPTARPPPASGAGESSGGGGGGGHASSEGSELRRRATAARPDPATSQALAPSPAPAASSSSTALVPVPAQPAMSAALVPLLQGLNEDDLIAEFQCPICFDLLCRPVPIDCGMVVCESCLARTLKHNFTQTRRPPACPVLGATCRHGPVLRLPNVQAVLHNHLRTLLPRAYERRLAEDEENRALVKQVREAADNASGIISRAALVARRPRQPAPGNPRGLGHPAMIELQGIFQQLREDMEVLAADPIRFPAVLGDLPRIKMMLQYLLPTLLTIAAFLCFPGEAVEGQDLGTLRAMASTAFAQSYVVKSMGWWDVGLLMTCHGQAGFTYEVPQPLRSRLSGLKSLLWSRFAWPYERLLLASWMDPYHRLMATYYVVTWTLTTIYLTAYCIIARVRRRLRDGMPLKRILYGELGLLAYLIFTCEMWNVFWWWVCRFKFRVFECSMDYRLTPANVIENSIISLLLEIIFIFSLFMGATVDPNDYAMLTCTWLDRPEEWEKDLQATVLSRFAFIYVPRTVLNWF